MRKLGSWLRPLLAVGALLGATTGAVGCAPYGYYGGGVVVASAPPPPRYEAIGVAPWPGAFWVRGHWQWDGYRHVWIGGHWERPRSGWGWEHAHWERWGGGWRFVPGHWRRI